MAEFFRERFGYVHQGPLKVEFMEEPERPNDYRNRVLYASLYRGEITVEGKTYGMSAWGFDETVLAHEFAHFIFWDMLGCRYSGVGVGVPRNGEQFHAVQEGYCDYLSAVATGSPLVGLRSFDPPLRDLQDRDFDKHRASGIPQFMGWGQFLWLLREDLAENVDFDRIVFESAGFLGRGGGLDGGVEALVESAEYLYGAKDLSGFESRVRLEHVQCYGDR